MTAKAYLLVEGHGEVAAAGNLVTRLSNALTPWMPWANPRRWKNLHQWEPRSGDGGVRKGAEFIRMKADAAALLILRDADDSCPKDVAPRMAAALRGLRLPFPTAYVLFCPEYEVIFLPCLDDIGGFPPWDGNGWEARRGVKEWLSGKLPRGRSYKPTTSQLEYTRRVDVTKLRAAEVPCLETLDRALIFLHESRSMGRGFVYPG